MQVTLCTVSPWNSPIKVIAWSSALVRDALLFFLAVWFAGDALLISPMFHQVSGLCELAPKRIIILPHILARACCTQIFCPKNFFSRLSRSYCFAFSTITFLPFSGTYRQQKIGVDYDVTFGPNKGQKVALEISEISWSRVSVPSYSFNKYCGFRVPEKYYRVCLVGS